MEDSDQNKLFVGGISWETTEQSLRDHFNKYGKVVGCVIAKDRTTGGPRGFAFVSFEDPSSCNQALHDTHEILSRTVEVKKAIPRTEQQQQNRGMNMNNRNNGNFRTKKIFVGGLSANLTEEEFKGYFERFGRITDVVVMHDNMTHRPRGFGFISFESEDSVEQVMLKNFHELSGKLVEVKRAVPKEGNNTRGGSNLNFNNSFYQHGNFSPSVSRYGGVGGVGGGGVGVHHPGYGPFPVYGGVPYGGGIYGGFGYGVGPFGGPRMMGIQGPVNMYHHHHNTPPPPSGYMNGGVGLMGGGGGYIGGGFGSMPKM